VPLLPITNRFTLLSITDKEYDPYSESEGETFAPSTPLPTQPRPAPYQRLRRWERRLPKAFTVATVTNASSLTLKVEVQTTDTAEVKSVSALVDSGATGLFIDQEYVRINRFTTRKLTRPIVLYNVDGTHNEAGAIHEVVDLILRYQGHSERALFAVTSLGNQKMLLGYPWLREHNPEIDWQT
jgi:hypothetical protein